MPSSRTQVFGGHKDHGYSVGDILYAPVAGRWPYWKVTRITRNPGSEDWPARQFPVLIHEVQISKREYDAETDRILEAGSARSGCLTAALVAVVLIALAGLAGVASMLAQR